MGKLGSMSQLEEGTSESWTDFGRILLLLALALRAQLRYA